MSIRTSYPIVKFILNKIKNIKIILIGTAILEKLDFFITLFSEINSISILFVLLFLSGRTFSKKVLNFSLLKTDNPFSIMQ